MNREGHNKIVWITWERQIRNRSMTDALGIPLYEFLYHGNPVIRYIKNILATTALFYKTRPSLVVCQNPSNVLVVLLLVLKKVNTFKVGIDAHFGGVNARNRSFPFASQLLLNWCNRSADFVIVTNENQADFIRNLGGKVFVCPDPLPNLDKYSVIKESITKKVFLICSYDDDEPFLEVFEAADILQPDGFVLYVSGNYCKQKLLPQDFPHIKLLGFVSEDEFYQHLFSSEVVIDLTNNDDCLVCGAYEALAARKPIVLSNKQRLIEYFTGGTVFTENSANEIAEAVKCAYLKKRQLEEDASQWCMQAKLDIDMKISQLNGIIVDFVRK
jgi:glycosyltransferase involved in cell wall biosynthesis